MRSGRSIRPGFPSLPKMNKGGLFILALWFFLFFLITDCKPGKQKDTDYKIVSRHAHFHKIIPADARLETIVQGRVWLEGPVWDKAKGRLLFSDIPLNAVYQWKESQGERLFLKPSGYSGSTPFQGREPGSNGLAFDSQGRLLLCEHGNRRITRLESEKDGSRTILADRYQGRRLNSPNDLLLSSDGSLYFTDPPFGLPKAFKDPGRELDFAGVYRLSTEGKLQLLTKEVEAPNGLALSPDERTLYVSNADRNKALYYAFPLKADGSLSGKKQIFFDAGRLAKTKGGGAPDGMAVDQAGNIFAAGPGGLHLLSPKGVYLGSIELDIPVSNCAWGDDGSTLYITANTTVRRIRLNTKGLGF